MVFRPLFEQKCKMVGSKRNVKKLVCLLIKATILASDWSGNSWTQKEYNLSRLRFEPDIFRITVGKAEVKYRPGRQDTIQ